MSFAVSDHAAPLRPATVPREGLVWAAAFAAATLIGGALVAVAPLAAYVWLIALFGIPHVVSELRYCDERFAGRSSRGALAAVGAILGALALTRVLGTYGVVSGAITGPLELGLGAALAAAAALFMRRHRWIGLIVAAAVTYGAIWQPIPTFLIWAWLHNLTPLAFVAEATEGRTRVKAIGLLLIPFALVPAFVALGGLQWIAGLFGHDPRDAASAFGAGLRPLQAFLPSMRDYDSTVNLFQAAVISQVMHYVAVICLMPRLLTRGAEQPGRLAPWPRWPVFYALLAAAGLFSLGFYWLSFTEARSAYALAAALHSWIELPIFLLALGGGFRSPIARRSPPAPTTH